MCCKKFFPTVLVLIGLVLIGAVAMDYLFGFPRVDASYVIIGLLFVAVGVFMGGKAEAKPKARARPRPRPKKKPARRKPTRRARPRRRR